ncbi:MAG TPA: hypothetical protein VJO53_01460 [Candidatus Acidoferrales bacterium]|nr:hypothetical protein [Candidatus Acidoferrales bacterium]
MRIGLNIAGVVLIIFGGVWILQGLNMFPGHSFMNGQLKWSVIGGVAFVVGILVLFRANRQRQAT